ncbi:LOW QUALITY PROTEIN: uncharacterized protein LOC129731587 [Wyeomyia smithii]|uniref:LOW QUALITY PROTEIN: uncharacterized protein LOC129731587 n=1 Tax=Wyeomyia smithii TaxID=174621 RepID=UPI0024680A0B|nr:LOW QUALITY PROTEIN: uncharacterized protein LOC129731587 [Wyeomyia smithii]
MFSTHDQLRKRTPKEGIDRREYISLLVDEYYETQSLEAQQQVTANLANFAYDPINWNFLKQAKAHELFVEILTHSIDPLLLLHAAAGICNLCLDVHVAEYIVRGATIQQIQTLIAKYRKSNELLGHLLTTLIYVKGNTLESDFLKLLETLKNGNNRKISNLVEVLLQNHAVATNQTVLQQEVASNRTNPRMRKTFQQQDLVRFAEFTADSNPIHQQQNTRQSFVNGALLNAVTAGIIGNAFPGYVVTSQQFRFPNRCRLDEEILFQVKVEDTRKIVGLSYKCVQTGQIVFEGTAKLFAVKLL